MSVVEDVGKVKNAKGQAQNHKEVRFAQGNLHMVVENQRFRLWAGMPR